MRSFLVIVAAASLVVGGALAQTENPPANSGPSNPAVKTTQGNNARAPVSAEQARKEPEMYTRMGAP
jgi:hypothetical protein